MNAQEIWKAAEGCLRAVGQGKEVRTITVSSLGEAIVLIDQNGNPLAPGIGGTDERGKEELDWLKEKLGERMLTEVTGQNLSTIYSVNKILWVKKHKEQWYEEAWKILTFQDYIIYRLCGEAVIDRSMASRTLLFDINTNNWSEKILSVTGIDREKLARVQPAGSEAGELTSAEAVRLGLPRQVKIVVGTHDHICNAIGSGVCDEGSCADTVGTTEGLTAVLLREQLSSEHIEKYQISCEPFAVSGLYNTVAWNNTSGVLLKWFVNEFVREERPETILQTYDKLNAVMGKEPTSLFVLPHFSGAATPYMDSASKGVILGLTLGTKREDIYKALMEGANYELSMILEGLVQAGLRPKKLVATGGALSPNLLQIKADILNLPVATVKNRQTGTLGGAILGTVADGFYTDIRAAVSHMVQEADLYEPDQRRSTIYREKRNVYQQIYPAVAKISHCII